MPAQSDSEEVARRVAQAEEALRRMGFAESTIKRRRKVTRALIEAHLTERKP